MNDTNEERKKAPMVTFFTRHEGHIFVGVGLNDDFIQELKNGSGVAMAKNNMPEGIDGVIIVYAPTLNEMVKKAKSLIGPDKTEVKVL